MTARPGVGVRASRIAALAVVSLLAVSACSDGGSTATTKRRAVVKARGATVMPFDLDRTTHVFRNDATGGIQRVVANDPDDSEQIQLIREHLRDEAKRFEAGDFTDPMAIHGMKMPGVAELRRGAGNVSIEYTKIARGAKVSYVATDPLLVRALHDWFDAQTMDHG